MPEEIGLSEKEALKRLEKYGKNIPIETGQFQFLKELVSIFLNPLILLLLGASFVSMLLGDITDFIIIFIIVILSGCISFLQHFKAENAAKRLKNKVLLTATVIRDGETREIPVTHVTIGDLIVLSVGDLVPADANLIEIKEFSVDESTLTGESYPAEKKISNARQGKVFAGTHVVTGEGKALVTTIGKETELGRLSEKVVESKPQTTFDKELSSFSLLVVRVVLVLAISVFGINIFFHHNFINSFLFAVALAVGLTPELMPIVLTVSLSRGALRMEEKDVIVKYLPSIQNLGSMDILCMDKTGTITESNITLQSYEDIFGQKNENVLSFAKVNSFFQSGYKNPLDNALLLYTNNIDIHQYKKIDEIPFDFERKMLSIVATDGKGILMITKGAPQKIVENSSFYQQGGKRLRLTKEKIHLLQEKFVQLGNNGSRVVAIAMKQVQKKSSYTHVDEKDLVFLGFLIFADPVKKTVVQTLQHLLKLGIKPKILTGDNEIITKKTCADANIIVDHVLLGEEVKKMTDQELSAAVETTTIFASVNPQEKARIISSLRANHHTVGFLGDGINDAPPLKAADIGISVNNGSDIAKDVADIILMRKSLTVLIDGVIEGRKTYRNTFKYIMMSLSSNFGNMVSIALASLFLPFLPMLPVQILLIDFLYDSSQIAVPSDNVETETVVLPQKWSIHFLKRFMLAFGPLSSLFDIATFCILFFALHASIPFFRTGWFLESFFTQTLIIFAIRTHKVPFFRSIPSKWLMLSALFTLLVGTVIALSGIGKYFSFVGVPSLFWFILIGEILLYFTLVEVTKIWFYRDSK